MIILTLNHNIENNDLKLYYKKVSRVHSLNRTLLMHLVPNIVKIINSKNDINFEGILLGICTLFNFIGFSITSNIIVSKLQTPHPPFRGMQRLPLTLN